MIRVRGREQDKKEKEIKREENELNELEHDLWIVGEQTERSTRSIRLLDRSSMLAVELSTGFVDSSNDQDSAPRNTSKFRKRKDT